MITLEGKNILVTGAGRGIGEAIARECLKQGANVILHYNSGPAKTTEIVAEYGADRAIAIQANLESPEDRDRLFNESLNWQGQLHGLVNNAGIMTPTEVSDPLDSWRQSWRSMMAINVEAVADLCYHAVNYFKTVGGGQIVNVASRAAFRGDQPDSMHYAASKGAVVAFTRSLAKGFAADNIYSYIVAPGWVMTERVRPTLENPENAFMLDEVPMQKAAPPEELGNLVAFLMSGQVTHATGSTFDVNGASYFH